jgi:hypothetical protein
VVETKKSFCAFLGCQRAFSRDSDLQRHVKTVHLKSEVFWCPVAGCSRALGANHPFPRKDKRKDHFLKVHGGEQTIDFQVFDASVGRLVLENFPQETSLISTLGLDQAAFGSEQLGADSPSHYALELDPLADHSIEFDAPIAPEDMFHGAIRGTMDSTMPTPWMHFSSTPFYNYFDAMNAVLNSNAGIDLLTQNSMDTTPFESDHHMPHALNGYQFIATNGNAAIDFNDSMPLDGWNGFPNAHPSAGSGQLGFDQDRFVHANSLNENSMGFGGAEDGNAHAGDAVMQNGSGNVEDWSWSWYDLGNPQ